jgi:hypothetical protein
MQARLAELDTAHAAELTQLESVSRDAQAEHESDEAAIEPPVNPLTPAQKRFYASDQCETARQALQELVDNPLYNTDSDYYSDNARDFVDRHLHVLSTRPTANLAGYISNLKLMTKLRR